MMLDFLKKLKTNNNKEWFDKNREKYEEARAEFSEAVGVLINKIAEFDDTIKGVEVKDCIFRINRDVRFSKDKSPYKTNFAAVIGSEGKKTAGPCYYFHVMPGNSMIGGGVYMPPPDILKKIREEIDYSGKDLEKLLAGKEFKKYFDGLDEDDKLKKVPAGFENDNPFAELLKLKSYFVVKPIEDQAIRDGKYFTDASKAFRQVHLLNQFLKRNL